VSINFCPNCVPFLLTIYREVPEDIRVQSLDDYQMGELRKLKDWLHHQRIKVRQERDRTDRRLEREKAESQRKAEQPALFDF
jgi:hypothetical protein